MLCFPAEVVQSADAEDEVFVNCKQLFYCHIRKPRCNRAQHGHKFVFGGFFLENMLGDGS